jgi:hypothetical protein
MLANKNKLIYELWGYIMSRDDLFGTLQAGNIKLLTAKLSYLAEILQGQSLEQLLNEATDQDLAWATLAVPLFEKGQISKGQVQLDKVQGDDLFTLLAVYKMDQENEQLKQVEIRAPSNLLGQSIAELGKLPFIQEAALYDLKYAALACAGVKHGLTLEDASAQRSLQSIQDDDLKLFVTDAIQQNRVEKQRPSQAAKSAVAAAVAAAVGGRGVFEGSECTSLPACERDVSLGK